MGTLSPTPSTDTPPTSTRVSRRVAGVSASATLAIDSKAKSLKAAGENVISFGAGEPDFPTMPEVAEAAAAACRETKNHRYTPTAGLPELREAIAQATFRDSKLQVQISQVLVTNGGKQAVSHAFATLLDPGDEVLVPTPYWTTYPESIRLAGGRPVPVIASIEQQFKVTVEQLERARGPRTKMLLLVSPSNPTGAVYEEEQLIAIGKWADEHGLWVLSDDIYEHLVYGGRRRFSLPELVPEIADRTVLVNGVAKTYAMTGWRVGWMVGPSDVIEAATNLQSQETSNVANVSQRAAIAALEIGPSAVKSMVEAFDVRRKSMWQLLNEVPGMHCVEPEGAFYAFPSLERLLGVQLRGGLTNSSAEFAQALLEQEKVAIVPGEAFGTPGFARLSYALSDGDLQEGLARIAKFVEHS